MKENFDNTFLKLKVMFKGGIKSNVFNSLLFKTFQSSFNLRAFNDFLRTSAGVFLS